MTYTTCSTCGALSAPWSLGHAPHCAGYRPPASARLCPVCSLPMRVSYVRVAERGVHGAEVEFRCSRCDDVAWIETTEPDDEAEDDGA